MCVHTCVCVRGGGARVRPPAPLCVEAAFSLGLVRVQEVHGVPGGDEQDGNDHQDAKVLWLRGRDHHDEMEQVHQVVHGALDAIDHAPLRLTDALLQQLGHRQVEGPQT